jgi:hypothetical protein
MKNPETGVAQGSRMCKSALRLAIFLLVAAASGNPARAADDACDEAKDACYFSLAVPGDGKQILHYYASENPELAHLQSEPVLALIALHGHSRDANKTFNAALLAAQKAHVAESTLIIAPVFQVASAQSAKCSTAGVPGPAENDLLWTCSSWQEGGTAQNGSHPSSFAAMDALVLELKRRFPSLRTITIAGFSAGAQTVQHYIGFAANAPESVNLRFVVADPGSWLYFDAERPVLTQNGTPAEWSACLDGDTLRAGCEMSLSNQYAEACPDYNNWKYGTASIPANLLRTADAARKHYIDADVSYLEGDKDADNSRGTAYRVLDRSCPAETQGPYRLQRGLAYAFYDRRQLATGRHALAIVPGCAHDVACVFPSDAGRAALFGADR